MNRTVCSGEAIILYMSQALGCFSILVSFIGSGSNRATGSGWVKQEEPPSSLFVR